MPQLQINQGPQDALLYDNSRSYFTNVGYVRTSNFQTEYREVDPQNTAQLGSTVTYVIPKAADLLGPCDLRVNLAAALSPVGNFINQATAADTRVFAQWVDELGFAMIEKITFSIGSVDIETITGEQLQIKNELMTSDEMRLGFDHTLKTGRRAFKWPAAGTNNPPLSTAEQCGTVADRAINKDYTRLIAFSDYQGAAAVNGSCEARELIIPLGLFFSKHVSQYFPLAAVAGCNDVRIAIKFRAFNELVQLATQGTHDTTIDATKTGLFGGEPITSAKLMCHYVHVTGPEAQTLMNKEHVRLLKLWQHQTTTKTFTSGSQPTSIEADLSFLHPVSTLLITIRREGDMTTSLSGSDAAQKGYFFYHGDGTNPNYDRDIDSANVVVAGGSEHSIKVKSIQLTLNGQERHPGLDKGIDTSYLNARLLPMLHSNSNAYQKQIIGSMNANTTDTGATSVSNPIMEATPEYQRYQLQGSKNILVYPFSLNPEGSNPSGAVNFSKVSHAKLKLHLEAPAANTPTANDAKPIATTPGNYKIDVYALYYNWLQIKDGRALLSFA